MGNALPHGKGKQFPLAAPSPLFPASHPCLPDQEALVPSKNPSKSNHLPRMRKSLRFGPQLAKSHGKTHTVTDRNRSQSEKRGPYHVSTLRSTCLLPRRNLRHHASRPLQHPGLTPETFTSPTLPRVICPTQAALPFSRAPGTPCQTQLILRLPWGLRFKSRHSPTPPRAHPSSHRYPTNFNRPRSTTECRATSSRCGKSTRK